MLIKTHPDEFQDYLSDASNMAGGWANRLCIPESVDEIADILRTANDTSTPVTISGARTGTVGAATPFGGDLISLEKLNRIKSIDRDAKRAVVEPGVVLADLQKAVEAEGLYYPPDPTEWSCQIGGTVATNASGARSFKYGSTRDFVNRIRVVLAGGDMVDIARGQFVSDSSGVLNIYTGSQNLEIVAPTYERPNVSKNVSGYFNASPLDAIDLFIGSEGTLGVIVEIELRLVPKPKEFFSGIVFFESHAEIMAFVSEARSASLSNEGSDGFGASFIEYFDAHALRFISEQFPETPESRAGAIFFEQETTAENEGGLLERWNAMLERHGADIDGSWFTTTDQDREKMRAFRHALPVSVNERIVRHGQRKVGTDMAVPVKNFETFLQFYRQILDASGLEYIIFGHIGDCHLHANMIPRDAGEAERARHIYGRCVAQALMLGGTVSAEHGIGKLKRKYLSAMMGERYLSEMIEIKRTLDPNGILGRGNIFDEVLLGS